MLNFTFISALVLLSIISLVSYNQVKTLITANHWVSHTHQVIQAIESADRALYAAKKSGRNKVVCAE